jgi:hypothetical protein
VVLNTIGADMARGSLTGSALRNADGSWIIDTMRLNEIRLQSDKSLMDFFAPLTTLLSADWPSGRDRRPAAGPGLGGDRSRFKPAQPDPEQRRLAKPGGRLSMNASEFIYGSLHLFDPILNAEFSPQGMALRQFTSRWEGGMVRTSGNWLRDGKALVLDDVAIAGLEYTLPQNWKTLWMEPLPEWLNSVTLQKFGLSRNLVIDIDPAFPWQITSLDGYGANLQLVKDRQWGVWSGSATLNGAAATFNRVDVRRPSLALNANAATVNITDLSAFTEKGILEATATVSQLPQRQTTVSLNGRGVPLNVLQQWGWPALPITGDGNIQLTASGSVQANAPLKPTVNGKLNAVNMDKQQVAADDDGRRGVDTGNKKPGGGEFPLPVGEGQTAFTVGPVSEAPPGIKE